MAVAIMTVGSVGIIGLQQATTNGNRSAREMATATDLTRLYIERVRRDALMWNERARPASPPTNYLFKVPAVGGPATGDWFKPAVVGTESYGFTYAGADTTILADMYFCTNLRASWVIGADAIRVDARVWWHRTASNTARGAGLNCDSDATIAVTPALTAAAPIIRVVTASTVVRWQRLNN